MTQHELDGIRAENERLTAELAEEKEKLNTILYDVDYKGGLQDWQKRTTDALLLAHSTWTELAAVTDERDALKAFKDRVVERMPMLLGGTPPMTTESTPDATSARLPFRVNAHGFVEDATGSRVLVCSEDTDCTLRFNERAVESDGHFMCPNCGRLGQRMVEARPDQCGLTPNGNLTSPKNTRRNRLKAENERLREWIRSEGMRMDECTYDVLGEICEGCRCKRYYDGKPPNKKLGHTAPTTT